MSFSLMAHPKGPGSLTLSLALCKPGDFLNGDPGAVSGQ